MLLIGRLGVFEYQRSLKNLKVKINSEKSPEPRIDITEQKTKYIKYIRLFSLLPHKQDFNINSVHITETVMLKLISTSQAISC